MREVAVFSLASHMVWCLWGLKQVFRLERIVEHRTSLADLIQSHTLSLPSQILFQGQTSSIPFAYYHFARDKLEDYREAKARAESFLLESEVATS